MYRHIVLAYDGSESGQEALRQGSELARLCGSKVTLFAVIDRANDIILAEGGFPADISERDRSELSRVAHDGAHELRAAGLEVETLLGFGNPAQEIGALALRVGADLVVVGHREKGPLAQWWSGSVGKSLLAHAPCSILVAVVEHPE